MTPAQVAVNATITRWLAERLEGWGLAEPQERAEYLVRELLDQGLRKAEPLPPMAGPRSSAQRRQEAKAAIDKAIADAKAKRRANEPPTPATGWQLRRLGELMQTHLPAHQQDGPSRLAWASSMCNRSLRSAVDLSYEEAVELIKYLKSPSEDDEGSVTSSSRIARM